MTDIMASIGLAQLKRYPDLLKKRKAIIEKYDKAFDELGLLHLTHYTDTASSSGHLYLLRIPGIDVKERNELIIKMAEKGVTTNVHYKPLPLLCAYKNIGFDIKNYPNAYDIYRNEISLPLHTLLTDEETDYIINTLKGLI